MERDKNTFFAEMSERRWDEKIAAEAKLNAGRFSKAE